MTTPSQPDRPGDRPDRDRERDPGRPGDPARPGAHPDQDLPEGEKPKPTQQPADKPAEPKR